MQWRINPLPTALPSMLQNLAMKLTGKIWNFSTQNRIGERGKSTPAKTYLKCYNEPGKRTRYSRLLERIQCRCSKNFLQKSSCKEIALAISSCILFVYLHFPLPFFEFVLCRAWFDEKLRERKRPILQCSDGCGLTRGMRVRNSRVRNAERQSLFRH